MDTITTAAGTYTPPTGSSIQEVELHLGRREAPPRVYLTQYDYTVPIIMAHLFSGDQPYQVPAGAAVNIRMHKPDGTHAYNPALGLNNDRTAAYIAVTTQMSAADGIGRAIVEIATSSGVIGTAQMVLEIDQNPVPEDAVESGDEFKSLDQYVRDAETSAQAAKRSEDAAEKSSNDAAKSAQQAEEAANTAANDVAEQLQGYVTDAETARDASQDAQKQAEFARDEAQQASDSAAESAAEAAQNAETAKQYGGNPPIVGENGNWWTWNANSQEYQDTEKRSVLNYDITYSSVAEMESDVNNQPVDTIAIISSDVSEEDNAKLFIKLADGSWGFLTDLSGPPGVGTLSWEKTDGTGEPGTSDTYTVTLTDGRSFSYQVYNGSDGIGSIPKHLIVGEDSELPASMIADADTLNGQPAEYYETEAISEEEIEVIWNEVFEVSA